MKLFSLGFLRETRVKAKRFLARVWDSVLALRKAFFRLPRRDKQRILWAGASLFAIVLIVSVGVATSHKKEKKPPHPLDGYVNPTQIDPAYRFRGSYHLHFNDLNALHLVAARQWGVDPVGIDSIGVGHEYGMLLVETDSVLKVDRLSHSRPYLVPEAYFLLHDIASDFAAMLRRKGIPPHRLVATSFTRTRAQRHRLSRVNVNAATESAHCYGTTFDISWSRFDPVTDSLVRDDKLKLILASVIDQYRLAGRCYIKHERKQACFHITAIGSQEGFNEEEALAR